MVTEYLCEIAYRVGLYVGEGKFDLDDQIAGDELDITVDLMLKFYEFIDKEVNEPEKDEPYLCTLDEILTEETIEDLWERFKEEIRYDKISSTLHEYVVGKRYHSFDEMIIELKEKFNISFGPVSEEDAQGDYEAIGGINKDWGYAELYYMKGITGILVTELNISRE